MSIPEARTTITYDAGVVIPDPRGADIGFFSGGTSPWQVTAGDHVQLEYQLHDYGNEVADEVSLRVTLPPTLQAVAGSARGWSCTQLSDGWDCAYSYRPVDPGTDVPLAIFTVTVVDGAPGDLLTIDAVAATSSTG